MDKTWSSVAAVKLSSLGFTRIWLSVGSSITAGAGGGAVGTAVVVAPGAGGVVGTAGSAVVDAGALVTTALGVISVGPGGGGMIRGGCEVAGLFVLPSVTM